MARLAPLKEVLRALFARSGNQCAFPGCTQLLVNDKNQFIAQVCHIEAALPNGERYNPEQTDEERRSYDNLLILCYPHHVETDDVQAFSVEALKEMKYEHEAKFKKDFDIAEDTLEQLTTKSNEYWENIERLNTVEHSMQELAFRVNSKSNFEEICENANSTIDDIGGMVETLRLSEEECLNDMKQLLQETGIDPGPLDQVPYYNNPLFNRNWETYNLMAPNLIQRMKIELLHMKVKHLELELMSKPENQELEQRLTRARESLAEVAQHAIHVD